MLHLTRVRDYVSKSTSRNGCAVWFEVTLEGRTYITTDFQFRTNTELCTSAFGDANRLYYPVFVAFKIEGPLVERARRDMH